MLLHMEQGEMVTLDRKDARLRVRCSHGCLWVTLQGETNDYIIRGGCEREFQLRGRMVITALQTSLCFPESLAAVLPGLSRARA